jgi:four helix bundle protein
MKTERTNFESLQVYKLSEELADNVWVIVDGWKLLREIPSASNLVRSADSIGANIAEGTGRSSYQDNKRFVYIARGSINETKHWLRRAYKRGLLTGEQTDRLKLILDALAPKLNAYMKSIGNYKSLS